VERQLLKLNELLRDRLTTIDKGVPDVLDNVSLLDVGNHRLNIQKDFFPTPVAVVHESALEWNIKLMAQFARDLGVELAPHGKTTMCPQIFQRQLNAGAWGITCATGAHLRTYLNHGVSRVIMANQLFDASVVRLVVDRLRAQPEFEFYGIVDSIEGVRFYQSVVAQTRNSRKLNLLIEVGLAGGRTGVRTREEAHGIAREIGAHRDELALTGFAAFEGIFRGTPRENEPRVEELVSMVRDIASFCDSQDFLRTDEIILSAGGSGYFDLVARSLVSLRLSRPTRVILRSGCYVTHDHGFYAAAIARLCERSKDTVFSSNSFRPGMEIWTTVQSVPEPGLAFITVGKRDVSHDLGLPTPLKLFRKNAAKAEDISDTTKIIGLNDHHGYLEFHDINLAIGDMVSVGVSHPCTTFDRWRYIYVVDDAYNVVEALRTFF
jgi:D-serine dehydratase